MPEHGGPKKTGHRSQKEDYELGGHEREAFEVRRDVCECIAARSAQRPMAAGGTPAAAKEEAPPERME